MRPRTLLVLFLLVVGLGAFVWFYERKLPSSEERAKEAKKVLALDTDDVLAVVLEGKDLKVRLERDKPPEAKAGEKGKGEKTGEAAPPEAASQPAGSTWRITQPLAAPADRWAVDRLLKEVADLEKKRTIEGVDRAAVGLATPRGRIVLVTKAGEKAIEIGAVVPTSKDSVVAVAGAKDAYVVSDDLFAEVSKKPSEWRDKEIFHGSREAVDRMTLTGASGKVLLAKRGKDFWLESPLSDQADRTEVDRLLGDVTGLRAASFVEAGEKPDAELGLAPPQGSIEVVLSGQSAPFTVEVGGKGATGSDHYARVGSVTFTTTTDLGSWVAKAPADWRSHGWSPYEAYQIDDVDAKDAAGTLHLERSGTDWQRGTAEKISFTEVASLLAAVTGARADSLLDAAEAGQRGARLDAPTLTLTLTASDGAKADLTLYPALADGAVPAKAAGRDAVLLLPAAKAQDVVDKLAAVRAAKALPQEEKKDEKKDEGAKKPG